MRIKPLAAKVSAHCNRVPVVDGHTVTVSVELERKPSLRTMSSSAIEQFSQRAAAAQASERAARSR